jgi:LCP family protein required for cell wall assembly
LLLGIVLVAGLVYLLAPLRTNLLVLGIDRVPDGSAVGRSDTIILVSVVPLQPEVRMLSIPRDLWVNVPGVGENRINTAHFFAEANEAGSGPAAAVETVEQNFGVSVPYYVRVQFEGFMRVVDALGGVTVNLPEATATLPAGQHHLNSEQALAYVRDRQGADDFFRMAHGQTLIRAVIRQILSPASWERLPAVATVARESIETNLPIWQWPRLGLAVLRAGDGIDSRTITRDLVTPFTTSGGASVLLPNWDRINPLVSEMFGQ